jgi:hypothetical protein
VTALTGNLYCEHRNLALTDLRVRRFWRAQRRRGTTGLGTMQYLLILLVAVTLACGAAATATIVLAPAYADAGAQGYSSETNP